MEVARRRAIRENPLPAPRRIGAQVMQRRLDVLAGAEEVGLEVRTGAAVVGGIERSQRDEIGARGGRGDLVLTEESLPPAGPPAQLEQLRGAARLAAAELGVAGRGRLGRVLRS